MKKYQLWLERKTYSQHLNNLMRIKLQTSEHRLPFKSNRGMVRSVDKHAQASVSKDTSSCFLSPRDISYIITTRQLQKHKLRLVRSNQIVRQNQQIVKRLNKIKPFVSNTRPIENSTYKLKRRMQRANEEQNTSLKDQHFKQFQKTYAQNAKITHKYQLTITVEDSNQKASAHPSTQICLEILAPHSIAKSQYLPPNAINGHTFQFTFPEELPSFFTLRFNQVKKLNHSILSEFVLKIPEQGSSAYTDVVSKCKNASLKAGITYKKLKPKFWSIKLFRV